VVALGALVKVGLGKVQERQALRVQVVQAVDAPLLLVVVQEAGTGRIQASSDKAPLKA